MVICGNPLMSGENNVPAACNNGRVGCCRHCDLAKSCLEEAHTQDGCLCAYIHDKRDLKTKCPFEKEKEQS